ncbi:ABC transporter ATP-binding protein YtrB [Polaromonas vacuolata]|uniref:ABC transporter ATP-binding protein YtrB n=2 Tax=Polaromonas vacuolata TaxID=37448 RepID=A0A6H2HCS4_9BURK|nr:ABC transporter ATP-binding protein YtrB [Polaromonas vacuolata]
MASTKKEKRLFIENFAQPHSTLLMVNQLCYAWPQAKLFTNWSARIKPGVTWLIGDDGSGKTTLLRLLAGHLVKTSGQLQLGQTDLDLQPSQYSSQLFITEPGTEKYEQMTALDYFALVQRQYPSFEQHLLAELINGLSLQEHQHKMLYMLSTGSKRKVWLAAAFASGALLTLIDEPFAALDSASVEFVSTLLKLAATQTTRTYLVADYQALVGTPTTAIIELTATDMTN